MSRRPPTKVGITSETTSAIRGTANASYHQSPAMKTVPISAAAKPISPNQPALSASRS